MFCVLIKKIPCLCFKTQLKSWIRDCSFNDPKRVKMALSYCKKISALLRGITSKRYCDFYCLSSLHSLRKKTYLNRIKDYVEINIFVTLNCLLKTIKH